MMGTYLYSYEDPSDDWLRHLEVEYDRHPQRGVMILLVCDEHGNELTEAEWKAIVSPEDLIRAILRFEAN